jgi:CRISPR associated protein Cas1
MARTLYLTEQGSTLSRKDERLVVEKAGETLADIPASKVVRVFVFGNVSLTTPAIACLPKYALQSPEVLAWVPIEEYTRTPEITNHFVAPLLHPKPRSAGRILGYAV